VFKSQKPLIKKNLTWVDARPSKVMGILREKEASTRPVQEAGRRITLTNLIHTVKDTDRVHKGSQWVRVMEVRKTHNKWYRSQEDSVGRNMKVNLNPDTMALLRKKDFDL